MDNVLFNRIFAISAVENECQLIEISKDRFELDSYISELVQHVDYNSNSKSYVFETTKNTTKNLIEKLGSACINVDNSVFEQIVNEHSEALSKKLLAEEVKTQNKIKQLNRNVLTGVLVFTMLRWKEDLKLIISKADNDSYLYIQEFVKKIGLPLKKKIYKAAVFLINKDGVLNDEVKVFDTGNSIVKYWWDGFLELKAVRTDEFNTKQSFDSIDSVLKKYRSIYKEDYHLIRNSTVKYFRTQSVFKIEDFVAELKEYTPIDSSFKKDEIVKIIEDLPEKKKFDTLFTLENNKITARFLSVVNLGVDLELHLKKDIPDIMAKIRGYKLNTGEKGVFVFSEEGYEEFPKLNNNDKN